MPCSEARLAANKANAQKSTGPRTTQGKARSARNSATHGLSAHKVRLTPTERSRLSRLRKLWRTEFLPQTPEEHDLVEQGAYASLILERLDKITLQAHALGAFLAAEDFHLRYNPRWEHQYYRARRLLRRARNKRLKARSTVQKAPTNKSNPAKVSPLTQTQKPLPSQESPQISAPAPPSFPAHPAHVHRHGDQHTSHPADSAPTNKSNPAPVST